MDALTEKLGIKLQEWKPEISDSAKQTLRERVRQYISEIIDLADRDVLDLLPSRTVEQDVLYLTDLSIIQPNSIASIRTHDAFLNSYTPADEGQEIKIVNLSSVLKNILEY
jgi:hypothetical protein